MLLDGIRVLVKEDWGAFSPSSIQGCSEADSVSLEQTIFE